MFEYINLHLTIHHRTSDGKYPLYIQSEVSGEQSGTFSIPWPDEEVSRFLGMLEARIGSVSHEIRRDSPERRKVEEFGEALFTCLLSTPTVRTCFDRTWARVQDNEQIGLRVRLTCYDHQLLRLPWELLHDGSRFLFVSGRVVLMRYIPLPEPIVPITVNLPLRVLVAIASPMDLPPLDVEKEVTLIEKAFNYLGDKVIIDILRGIGYKALQARLRQAQVKDASFHILHFVGHASHDIFSHIGYLAFEGEDHTLETCEGKILGQLLTSYSTLRLVILNACETTQPGGSKPHSGVAEALIKLGIPAVIAMQFPISDRMAVDFAGTFYEAVASGLPIDAALGEVRMAIYGHRDSLEFGTPVLYARIKDGHIFDKATFTESSETKASLSPSPKLPKPPSDEELLRDLLGSDPLRIRRAADFVSKMGKTQFFQGRLLELFNYPTASYQQRIAIGATFAFIGDPRDLEEMVLVPAGRFWLGSDVKYIQKMISRDDRYFSMNETPLQRQFLPDFRIAKYVVTNQQYLEFLQTMPGHPSPPHWENGRFPQELSNHPVVNVSWYDAITYARWKGKRLPTEFEWEKAARGTAKSQYPWGDIFDGEKCNVQLGIGGTTPVGVFLNGASYYGALDMIGNVWEWTESCYLPYPGFSGTEEHFGDVYRVMRGGSYFNVSYAARCTCRLVGEPTEKYSNIGFRLAESVKD